MEQDLEVRDREQEGVQVEVEQEEAVRAEADREWEEASEQDQAVIVSARIVVKRPPIQWDNHAMSRNARIAVHQCQDNAENIFLSLRCDFGDTRCQYTKQTGGNYNHRRITITGKKAMESTFWTAFGASLLAALVTTAGIYVIRRFEKWGQNNTIYFICFAAGVLVSVSFLHIIPKAFSMNANAPFYLLAGYFGLHLFNRFVEEVQSHGTRSRCSGGLCNNFIKIDSLTVYFRMTQEVILNAGFF